MSKALIVAALICFILAAAGVTASMVALVPLGLALYMVALLV